MHIRTRGLGAVSAAVTIVLLAAGLVGASGPPSPPPGLDRAIAAQEAHTDALLAKAGVVGTAVALAADGRPVVKVYTRSAGVRGLPAHLDGVPVDVEVTGEFVAQADHQGIGRSSGTERLIKKGRSLYCTVGTMGALVTGQGRTYALSNAHVYANEGSTTYGGPVVAEVKGGAGDSILQPGRVDMTAQACGSSGEIDAAEVGNLWDYASIVISRTASNFIDAAIAKLSVGVSNVTPDGWTPSSTPTDAVLTAPAQAVKKHGRTTGLTQGTVNAINATVLIRYDKGTARFVNQIVVKGNNGIAFSMGGDSGSLIVTSDGNHPVALLFAGSSTSTIGNPIGAVLTYFGVTIVGESP